jgi:hypothetical protein
MDESLYHINTPLGWGPYPVVEGCHAGAADGTLMGSVTGLRDLGTEGWWFWYDCTHALDTFRNSCGFDHACSVYTACRQT